MISLHRVPHLLCWRAFEVPGVGLRGRRLASTAPCEGFQSGELQYRGCSEPRDQLLRICFVGGRLKYQEYVCVPAVLHLQHPVKASNSGGCSIGAVPNPVIRYGS